MNLTDISVEQNIKSRVMIDPNTHGNLVYVNLYYKLLGKRIFNK